MNAIGLRFDEPRRVARIKDQRERWETIAPLMPPGAVRHATDRLRNTEVELRDR